MKIGIIGAGFTGLSASYKLINKNHEVTIFESDSAPGGLALGFHEEGWSWTLEKHYHHWFTNDQSILNLAKEINHRVIIKRPKTSIFVDGKIYQFDSPKEVLLFPIISILDRLRMGMVVGFLKFDPFWKPLEKFNATKILPKTLGKKTYELIWEPQFRNKFGPFAEDVSLAWFWARIAKRTPSLAYPQGGFLNFADHLTKEIEKKGGQIKFNSEVKKVENDKKIIVTVNENGKVKKYNFDKVIFTVPSFLFLSIAIGLPENYKRKFAKLNGLGATNLVLRLKKPFLPDNTYWLSICDKNSPVMAIVEHTNFMKNINYNKEHIIYLGNYLASDSKRYKMNKDEVLKLFDPFLKSINPKYKTDLINYELFKASFAQPIIPTNYSKMIPPFKTPLKNVYLANIEQVYPWDRGTNYAVELGEKIADYIFNED